MFGECHFIDVFAAATLPETPAFRCVLGQLSHGERWRRRTGGEAVAELEAEEQCLHPARAHHSDAPTTLHRPGREGRGV